MCLGGELGCHSDVLGVVEMRGVDHDRADAQRPGFGDARSGKRQVLHMIEMDRNG